MGVPALGIVRTIGRYSIFDEIASGGMATVYLGRLAGTGGFARTVAIKRLHPHLAKDPEFVAMFLDEARLAARIRHPNVVPTLDVVASQGEVFLVMEYVQGETLSRLARLQQNRGDRVPLPILLRIMSDVLNGLHAAHEARDERGVPLEIVHRDVTPQNILVGADGVARLLDFGVAKAAGRSHTTRDGAIKGKLSYLAPEQLMRTGLTRQSDVYAAAVVLWEMITGERLFTGDSELDVVGKLIRREVQSPRQLAPYIPAQLDEAVLKGLATSLDERFASAREMGAALARCGVQETAAINVGEWVEALAADALAERSAKIAAIASIPQSAVASSLLPPASVSRPSGAPTLAAARDGQLRDLAEPSSDVHSVSLNTGVLRRGARMRTWGVAAGVALMVGGAGFALARSLQGNSTVRSAAEAPPVEAAPMPPPATRVAPTPSAAPESLATDPHGNPDLATTLPRVHPSATSSASRAAPRPLPSRAHASREADPVFGSRE